MGKIIFLLFVSELILATLAVRFLGFFSTVFLYLAPIFLGFFVLSFQNRWIWFQFQKQMTTGQAPDSSLMNVLAKFVASILIIVPSLSCKIVSLLLWLPPTRFFLLKFAQVWVAQKIAKGSFRVFSQNGPRRPFDNEPRTERDAKVIDIDSMRIPPPPSAP